MSSFLMTKGPLFQFYDLGTLNYVSTNLLQTGYANYTSNISNEIEKLKNKQ